MQKRHRENYGIIIVIVENHQVHFAYLKSVVLLEYIAVKVLLQAIVIISGIGKPLQSILSIVPELLWIWVNLIAALPVINFICAVRLCAIC